METTAHSVATAFREEDDPVVYGYDHSSHGIEDRAVATGTEVSS